MSTTDLPDLEQEFLTKIDAQLEELEPQLAPLLERRDYLVGIKNKLTGPPPKASRGAGRPAAGASAARSAARPSGGTRLQQLIEVVRDKPGITVTEAANAMNERYGLNIEATYIYRVRAKGEDAGKLRKEGTKIFLADETESSEPSEARIKELEAAGASN